MRLQQSFNRRKERSGSCGVVTWAGSLSNVWYRIHTMVDMVWEHRYTQDQCNIQRHQVLEEQRWRLRRHDYNFQARNHPMLLRITSARRGQPSMYVEVVPAPHSTPSSQTQPLLENPFYTPGTRFPITSSTTSMVFLRKKVGQRCIVHFKKGFVSSPCNCSSNRACTMSTNSFRPSSQLSFPITLKSSTNNDVVIPNYILLQLSDNVLSIESDLRAIDHQRVSRSYIFTLFSVYTN